MPLAPTAPSAPPRGARRRWPARLRPLARSSRAAAIIEFALLAPVLITVLCGLADFALLIFVRLLTANSAQGMSDLASQTSRLQASDMANIYNAAYAMVKPFSASSLTLRITSYASDGNGRAFVYWSCGHGALAPLTAQSAQTTSPTSSQIKTNYLVLTNYSSGGYNYQGTNTSFVAVEAQNSWTSPTQYVLKGAQAISVVAYTLPRLSTFVGFPWDGVSTDYPTAPASTTKTASTTISAGGNTITCNYSL